MIHTPYGMNVKHVSHIDDDRQFATVIGFAGQVATYPIARMVTDRGIEELRESHANYLKTIKPQPHANEFAPIPAPTPTAAQFAAIPLGDHERAPNFDE